MQSVLETRSLLLFNPSNKNEQTNWFVMIVDGIGSEFLNGLWYENNYTFDVVCVCVLRDFRSGRAGFFFLYLISLWLSRREKEQNHFE